MKKRGTLDLYVGCMFSGKTTALIRRVENLRTFGKKQIAIFKPDIDSRSGDGIKDYHGNELLAYELPSERPEDIFLWLEVHRRQQNCIPDFVALDEVQFYPEKIVPVVGELLTQGFNIIAAGLALNFRGEKFGYTIDLAIFSKPGGNFTVLESCCAICGDPAHVPQRLIDGVPAHYESPIVQVGGQETYQARCWGCFKCPGKPSFHNTGIAFKIPP